MSGIKDVAKRAGVSISTVSNVLNKSKYVSPELAERVEQAARELHYEANPIAQSMKNNRSKIIGVLTEDMCGMFYPYVVRGINSVADEKGYQLLICDAQATYGGLEAFAREERLFEKLFANRVDGVIFASTVPYDQKESYFARIIKKANQYKPIPMVSLERNFSKIDIDSVWFDNYGNAKMAVQHLVDCGCKKIGHITGPGSLQIAQERVRGYKDCLKENGLSFNEDTMIVKGDYSHQSGYLAMQKMLWRTPDIDAVFCANDQMAIGAIKYLKEVGKRIPEDIKLMGYDDVFISSILSPSISTIHIQKRHAGIEAAKLLFERIEQNQGSGIVPAKNIKMEGKLVVRKSTVATATEDWLLNEW